MDPAPPTDEYTALRMSKQRTRDTDAEVTLRRILHARGLRYFVDRPLPGLPRRRADLTFSGQRVIVFVDGCFWHGCKIHKTEPKRNRAWWAAKIARTIERDQETDLHLESAGWTVVRVWEHEDPADAADQIEEAVRGVQATRSTPHSSSTQECR